MQCRGTLEFVSSIHTLAADSMETRQTVMPSVFGEGLLKHALASARRQRGKCASRTAKYSNL